MKKKTKLFLTSLSLIAPISFSLFPFLLVDLDNEKILLSNEKEVINPDNTYLINLKTNNNINFSEATLPGTPPDKYNYNEKFSILSVDGKYVELIEITNPDWSITNKNSLVLNIGELNKYNVGTQEFIESLSFNLKGGYFIFLNKDNKKQEKYFDFTSPTTPKMPFKLKFPENFKTNGKPYDFPSQEFLVETYDDNPLSNSQKYISILIEASYDFNKKKLFISPQFKALNNGIDKNPLSFNMPGGQDIFMEISSQFISKKNDVLLDEYISSQLRFSSHVNGDLTITNGPLGFSSYTFDKDNPSPGLLVNKKLSTEAGVNSPLLIDLKNIYFDDTITGRKEFDILLNNFKIKQLEKGNNIIFNGKEKGSSYPIVFKLRPDWTVVDNTVVTLEHNFLTNPTTGAFLKMSLNLLKKPKFTYEITSINFSSASGSGTEIYSLTIPKETQDFFSIAVKPSNFSIMKAIEEVKKINSSQTAIAIDSTYSSDVFDNSSLSGKTSNFSKVKMYLSLH
ncbi:MAG: hypothetical protein ACRC9U_02630 [Metamycoplasmataceae bacterium]